ncbi:hypothetical protein AAVH_39845 [Aphelenchoides avenae]|nr:hypothetical protein AAVH_39845 [Aphelenchus avenae]
MLVAVLLLIAGATVSVLPHAARDKRHRAPCDYYWDMIVSGTVYCDARKTRFPVEVKVTLKDWDDNEDDVAE